MARPLRIEYPGAIYHVTCRGNEQREIFQDDKDREKFLSILKESVSIYNIKIHSYVLMINHFHLLLETPLANLGEFMRRFNITYTGHYNRRHKRSGHLYQGRYKSILVDKDSYLSKVSRYIHLNPVRTSEMQNKGDDEKLGYIKGYRWSSLLGYIDGRKKERFIDYELVLAEYGGDNNRGRRGYLKELANDIKGSLNIKDEIVAQSILGSEKLINWVKEKFVGKEKIDRECPPMKALSSYRAKDQIIAEIEAESGMGMEEIKKEGGTIRQVAMDILCRLGGMKGCEVGDIFGVDYSTVSVARKRLREKMQKDRKVKELVERIEERLSIVKN